MTSVLRIEKLHREHKVESFECGSPPLNRFLVKFALQSQQSGSAITYVALEGERVIGFYSLVFGQLDYADAPERLTKGAPQHPVPVMLLARLAIASDCRGKGLGSGLLRDAMARTLPAAEIARLRALLVHAKDDQARAFYAHFGFVASPTRPYHLILPMKDIRAGLKG